MANDAGKWSGIKDRAILTALASQSAKQVTEDKGVKVSEDLGGVKWNDYNNKLPFNRA